MTGVRAVLIDIEGTTSTIAFVHEVLFPYADEHLDEHVAAHRDDPVVAQALRDAAVLAGEPDADEARILALLHQWIAEDRKVTPLKTLQGLIWEEGYARAGLRSHIYDDVEPVLRAWHAAGLQLYIYSSGSIAAQRLLFGNSIAGDLTPLFSDYFDTTIGPKTDAESYMAIATAIDLDPTEILFLSDNERELDAAAAADLQVVRLLRPADTPIGATTAYPSATDFTSIADELTASN